MSRAVSNKAIGGAYLSAVSEALNERTAAVMAGEMKLAILMMMPRDRDRRV